MTRKSDRFRPVRFCTVSPEAVCTWGGGGPPAAGGQSGSRRRAPGWLHWHAGDGDAGVQLPLARTSATSAGTSGTENQQTEGVLRGRGRAVGARRLGPEQAQGRSAGQSPGRETKAREGQGPGGGLTCGSCSADRRRPIQRPPAAPPAGGHARGPWGHPRCGGTRSGLCLWPPWPPHHQYPVLCTHLKKDTWSPYRLGLSRRDG